MVAYIKEEGGNERTSEKLTKIRSDEYNIVTERRRKEGSKEGRKEGNLYFGKYYIQDEIQYNTFSLGDHH